MNIAGFDKLSTVDWPGCVSAVVFTPGCTMNCAFCHNRILLGNPTNAGFAVEEVLATLKRRQGFLDGLVITGGEPTIQRGLEDFIRAVRELGFGVKLDTNGTRPEVVKHLIAEGLLDYVAMDVKAPWNRYEDVCGAPVNLDAVRATIRCLIEGTIPYEFRTTVLPYFQPEDIAGIAEIIHGAERYVLQQFRQDKEIVLRDSRLAEPPHSAQWFADRLAELRLRFPDVSTRGVDLQAANTA
ncbi:MAG: anaerobic ribonucleoside-triphosphate reductase activating protein [Candidatus Hydrogenedentota bacterium]